MKQRIQHWSTLIDGLTHTRNARWGNSSKRNTLHRSDLHSPSQKAWMDACMQDSRRGYNQCSWNIFYRTHARKNIFLRNAVRRKNMTVATPGGERGIEWQIKGRDFFIMNLRKCLWWWRLCSSRRRFLIVDLCCQWYACMCEPFGKHHNASFLGGKSSRDLNYDLPKHSKNPNCKHTIISKQIGHWFLVKMHRFRIHT